MKKRRFVFWFGLIGLMLTVISSGAMAGNLDPAKPPTTGTMHSLEDIYLKLDALDARVNRAPTAKTGQTISFATNDDGDLEKGLAYPDPRFVDNHDGTVTDNLTGLVWLKNANRFNARNWAQALSDCNGLADDGSNLTDGSVAGDWRLPNIRELQSIVTYGVYNPALSNAKGTGKWTSNDPFTGVQNNYYWSSSTHAESTDGAWHVHMGFGQVRYEMKTISEYVWPVRGGNN
jgi:hypothetical protein